MVNVSSHVRNTGVGAAVIYDWLDPSQDTHPAKDDGRRRNVDLVAECEPHIIECAPSHVACRDEIECPDIVMVIVSKDMVTYV